jgi:two-component system, NtrC family, sensor kinase
MTPSLQNIIDLLAKLPQISEAERTAIQKFVSDADKQLAIVEFKLDRTEKVKRTTAILLEETIEELEQKRKAIEEANVALQKSLEELKATQAQLIQAEKMASLGELTAGIAHEIQNPLNFVNNFSDVSQELISEMNDELAVGNYEFAKEIASDIEQNLVKIQHHGKRASAIVKGMLQHSRTGSGQKEPTDINALAEEYLRLSYHGLRSKDNSFNAEIKTEFDATLPKVEVVTQEMGRVMLNLITNAFYAVNERRKKGEDGYKPTVTVQTKASAKKIEVRVMDNGDGIPDEVKDKIFQPFFTTKPTGEGTGLGLSLSYDIVKAHGGELKVETKEGEGTTFTINIPTS